MKIATRLRLLIVGAIAITIGLIVALRGWADDMDDDLDEVMTSRYQLELGVEIEHNVMNELAMRAAGISGDELDQLGADTRSLIARLRASVFEEGEAHEMKWVDAFAALQASIEREPQRLVRDMHARADARNLVIGVVAAMVQGEKQQMTYSGHTLTIKE